MAKLKIRRSKFRVSATADTGTSQPIAADGVDESPIGNEPELTGDDNGTGSEAAAEFIEPELIAGEPDSADSGTPTRRKRGRPAGSTNKTSKAKASSNLETILFSLHNMAASFIIPELALSREESANLASAIQEVNALYPVAALSPEVMAWINLSIIAGGIYGPRFVAANMRYKKEAAAKRNPPQQPTLIMTPAPAPAPMGVN